MKKIISYIRSKLSIRVSLWVVLFAAIIFNAALGLLFYQAREAVRQEAVSRATQILDKTSLRVEGILNRVEVASNMTKWLVERHPDNADSMFVYSRGMLLNNPGFYNASIAFEPYHFKDKGRYFSAYTKYIGDSLRTIQGGSDSYQYFYVDWYLMPKLLERPCWTEPYFDLDVATNTSEMVTSYCQTLKDRQGQVIGVINTSLSISWLSHTVSAIKPYPNSYSIMIGRGGTYFVHPDSTKITRQTIFTHTLEQPDTALAALGHAMTNGEEGVKRMTVDGEDCYVFYKPLGKTGCSMAIVCPESDIFNGFDRLRRTIMTIITVGLLLMLGLFIRIITRELKPLRRLAKEAETIASGHFETALPDLQRIDEIGQLSHSFSNMQHSLVNYIDELKATTAQKASIESELKVASDIQMSMVPRIFPAFPNRKDIDLYASMTPAKEVGGDLYDFFVQDERLYFCIGDVSGKGIPASLFMAVTRNLFRIVAQQGLSPDKIATQINNIVSHDNEQNMFVTMFIGCADLQTGRLDYCNCGHNAPLLDGRFMDIKNTNFPLGVMEGVPFVGESIDDILSHQMLLYTDGLNEAENPQHEQFGDERVLDLMAGMLAADSKEVILMLQESVERHRDGADPSDDLTLLCLRIILPQ